jgi:hypothetical protein
MMSYFHPAISALAFFQSTQLNLFERFLTQAVSGIDSTSITSGMQNVAYVVLLVGFLWQVYQSALHGGDVRGLGTNLIKYAVTAVVVMNYHAVFTTINQGFVNAGNWVNSASGATNLLDNWASDLKTQYSQVGFQNLWGLVTGSTAGILDAALIVVAYILYPVVIAIFGFFYILYGSILYIFGPIVIALMPLGATNRLAKSYAENVFIWNAWPVLYGGFGALLSAVQMGQVGQMLNQNDFLGGLGNLEGSILIGLASIIYSLAIAVIPFIAKRIVSGEVGATAGTLLGAAATALTMGVAATEGAIAGAASSSGQVAPGGEKAGAGAGLGSSSNSSGTNQPAAPQRTTQADSGRQGPHSVAQSAPADTAAVQESGTGGDGIAENLRGSLRSAVDPSTRRTEDTAESGKEQASSLAQVTGSSSDKTKDGRSNLSSSKQQGSTSRGTSQPNGPSTALMRPHGLATWGAYHTARLATKGAMGGVRTAGTAAKSIASSLANPVETSGKIGAKVGEAAGNARNAVSHLSTTAKAVADAVTHPSETAQSAKTGVQSATDSVRATYSSAASTASRSARAIKTGFSDGYGKARSGEANKNDESE